MIKNKLGSLRYLYKNPDISESRDVSGFSVVKNSKYKRFEYEVSS